MAIHRKSKNDIQELVRRSEAARATLADAGAQLKQKLDVASRAKETLTSQPAKLVGGTLLTGFVLKKLFSRKPKYTESRKTERISHLKKERGFLLGLFALIAALAKPAAKMYAGKLVRDYLRNRFDSGASGRPRGFRQGHY